jgi:hypothetical protein
MENAPFHCGIVAKDNWLLDENETGAVRCIFAANLSTSDCIKMSAEREARRQCCASGFQVREIHRLFHKTVEKPACKVLVVSKNL